MQKNRLNESVVGAHLVGSVPFESVSKVFRVASKALGTHLHRIPDGEVGERTNWVAWQLPIFVGCDALEWAETDSGYSAASARRIRIKAGFSGADIQFGNLGYADAASESFRTFDRLQEEGVLAEHHRFQICLPTPVAPVHLWVQKEDQFAVEESYEVAMLGELEKILASLPDERIAIQWDTAVEFGVLEGCFPTYMKSPMADILSRLVRLGNAVPHTVELGFHLCYGDAGHKHFVEPNDVSKLVEVANELEARLDRRLNWIHFPVPKNRNDDAYFAPARKLKLSAETELYLGLLHSDGIAGAKQRIEAALRHIPRFGVATECGFGRRDTATIEDLMVQHADVSHSI